MKRALKLGCLGLLGLGILVTAILLILAWTAKPLPTTAEALASLPAVERSALEGVCHAAGIEASSLRHIGGWFGEIFEDQRNATSFVVREGRLVALCLRGVSFSTTPDFRDCTALQALSLKSSTLPAWPDFSKLIALTELTLTGTSLGDPVSAQLPPHVQTLALAHTRITRLDAFASLHDLRTLDASSTQVTTFEPLPGLALDALNLADTKVATLPATVPANGAWEVNLDGTPAVSPPGYALSLPDAPVTSKTADGDKVSGNVTRESVTAQGHLATVTQRRRIELPRCIVPNPPMVTLEVTVASGEARVWLREPAGLFASPWFERRKVKGFGVLRQPGWVTQVATATVPAKLRGRLDLRTTDRYYEAPADIRKQSGYIDPPDWCDHSFLIEPVDGAAVSGVDFRVTSTP